MKFLATLVILFQITSLSAQKTDKEQLILAYYNVDNLFDTDDDPTLEDNDWVLGGKKGWTVERYQNKIEGIVEILSENIEGKIPDLIVFSEVENKNILNDISGHRKMRRSRFDIILNEQTPGLALLAKEGLVSDIEVKEITSSLLPAESLISSSTLYLKCKMNDDNIYHLFINSWSPRSTQSVSPEAERMGMAAAVRKEIDRILNFEREARIMVLGTFNDEPTSRSLMMMLNATNKRRNLGDRDMYNLYYDMHNIDGLGTIMVNGLMQMYDYIIVSPKILKPGNGYSTGYQDAHIADIPENYFKATYRGEEYLGGISSHLPVYIILNRVLEK